MSKLIKTTLITLFVCGITIAQTQLSTENKKVLTDLIEKLDDESYLLKCKNNTNDAFLIYKFESNFIININQYTFSSDIFSDNFKNKIENLGGEIISFNHINSETDEVIKKISSYKFEIKSTDIERLNNIVINLLVNNHDNTKDQPLLFFESTGL